MSMTETVVERFIVIFDQLSDIEKQTVALTILRRTLQMELPPLSDEEHALNAEELFLELDRGEGEDARL